MNDEGVFCDVGKGVICVEECSEECATPSSPFLREM
jgi:hypothetical protein